MEQGIYQKGELSLQLKVTPGIYLQLEILQMPVLELEEAVKSEIEENPFIETEEVSELISSAEAGVFYEEGEEKEFSIPNRLSLRDLLLEQARWDLSGDKLKIAEFIVDNLDHRGFLTLSQEEISKRLKVSTDDVKKVREFIKTLAPVGCGSYSIEEAFAVQLMELEVDKKFLKGVRFLKELARGREVFKRKTGFSDEEVEVFLALLKRLDPEPGNLGEPAVRIVPDAKVWLDGEEVKVEVRELPSFKLRINSFYLKFSEGEKLRRFVLEKYQRAINLLKAIKQRNETLERVVKAVFEVQVGFLKNGKGLVPLSYRELSGKLGIHESTVGRAVKDKFVETPFGIYPLKFFFKKGILGVPADFIKEKIKDIIKDEDKKKPLSDAKIAEKLKKMGIKIARRTVAKYREELGIPGAFERKEK